MFLYPHHITISLESVLLLSQTHKHCFNWYYTFNDLQTTLLLTFFLDIASYLSLLCKKYLKPKRNSKYIFQLILLLSFPYNISVLWLGIFREDTLPLPQPPSQLSASQQRPLQYVLDVFSLMEPVSDEYHDDEMDVDNDAPIEVPYS